MKAIIISIITSFLSYASIAQDSLNKPTIFFSSGFVAPQFYNGIELLSAYANRQNGLSNFKASDGSQAEVGQYGANSGFSLSIGYYVPVKNTRLSLGLLVNSAQTGSTPTRSGYSEGYFFNFLNFAGGFHYFPLEDKNVYLEGELGMGSVFTKNRFLNESADQDFLHHFGIGLETGVSLGYSFYPFQNKQIGLFIEGQYQYYQTRVEVSNIGDDQWRFGALSISGGIEF